MPLSKSVVSHPSGTHSVANAIENMLGCVTFITVDHPYEQKNLLL